MVKEHISDFISRLREEGVDAFVLPWRAEKAKRATQRWLFTIMGILSCKLLTVPFANEIIMLSYQGVGLFYSLHTGD